MVNVKFLVASRGTIIIVITIFTLIPTISKRHARAGALSVIKAQCKLGKGGSTQFSSLERTRTHKNSKAGDTEPVLLYPGPVVLILTEAQGQRTQKMRIDYGNSPYRRESL